MDARERQRRAAWRVWQADVASRAEGDWADLGGLVVHTTGIPVRHWNGAHLTHPDGLGRLGAAADWFAERSMPWGLLVPAELWLTPPGMTHVVDQRVMLRRLEGLPPVPALPLRWDDTAGASAVQAASFGDRLDLTSAFVEPKLRNTACAVVTVYDGEQPVSTATLVVVDDVAAVFGVGTLPSHRRRGLGRAVTLAVLHEAVRRGADLAYLNPSDLGEPVYRALGFSDELPWRVWAPSPP